MRRIIGGSTAFLVLTGTLLVLPVYAAPVPEAEPVPPSIAQVDLGSVEAPAAEAVVATDDEVVSVGSDATVDVGSTILPPAPTDSGPAGSSEAPSGAEETGPVVEETVTEEEVAVSGDEVPGVPALTVSQNDTAGFEAVGVTWAHDPAVTGVRVQLRVQSGDDGWGEWTTLEQDDVEQTPTDSVDQEGLRDGTAPYYTGPADGVQVVVQALDGSTPADVQTQLIDPGTSDADTSLGAPAVQDQAQAALTMPAIYSRAQWGADESIRTWDPDFSPTIKAATVHHTADSNGYTAAAVPAILRSIYAFHTISRGWGDIGYNVIVDKFGRAWEGRYSGDRGISSPVIGAHAGGFNTYTFGVSMLGNYAEAPTTQPMVETVAAVIGWKLSLYGVDPRGWTTLTSSGGGTSKYAAGTTVSLPTVFGHRDVGSTTCPGQYGYAKLNDIRALAGAVYAERSTPQGSFDTAAGGFGQLRVTGWALDLDTPAQPTPVHAYLDGAFVTSITADVSRPDIAAAFPTAGRAHGFDTTLPATPGAHQVCLYALNTGAGSVNVLLGCRAVSVTGFQPDPVGSLDGASGLGTRIGLAGWALDGSTPTQPTPVHVYVDGRFVRSATADVRRPDIEAAYPGAGAAHGFDLSVASPPGAHTVCVYALNTGTGSANPLLGCRSVVVTSTPVAPVGSLDGVTVSGRVATVSGWVLDPDAADRAGSVHVYVDGRLERVLTADGPRPDVVAAFPGSAVDPARGYRDTLTLRSGAHQVCVFAINQGAGTDNPVQGCASVSVAAEAWNPSGRIDSASVSGITATVRGWALDPDTSGPVQVHLYVDGVYRTAVDADSTRTDVAEAFGVGPDHGLEARVSLSPGTHQVCGYAINSGQGTTHPPIGCTTVTIAASAWAAYGSLDEASAADGRITVRGWAVDPDDVTRTLQVHVYVASVGTALTADVSRPDVQAVYPGAGPRHGFSATLPAPQGGGPAQVCAYAIAVGDGTSNVPLGCRPVA